MIRKGDETGLLLISEAMARLEAGMFGGDLKRPAEVQMAKKTYPGASIGWGPPKKDAAKRIHEAITQGKLPVFVLADLAEGEVHRAPLQVPLGVLKRMIVTRGGLPDHAVQPMRIFAKGTVTPELLAALSKSALYVRRKEFDAWYKKARSKRNWPSQRSSCKPRMGRPPKQNDLRDPIVALVKDGQWSVRQKITDLVRLLESKGRVATRDTASRIVDQLFKETGEQRYRRRVRHRAVQRNGPN
jgi:hypothetical protein